MDVKETSDIPQWKKDLIARLRNQNKALATSSTATASDSQHHPVSSVLSRQASDEHYFVNGSPVKKIKMVQDRVWSDTKNDAFSEMMSENFHSNGYHKDSGSESEEDLHYGPGIVKKLKNKYLSLALRESNNRPSILHLRKATSLENLLDDDVSKDTENQQSQIKTNSNDSSYKNLPNKYVRRQGRGEMKRARSVETISRFDGNAAPIITNNRQSLHEDMLSVTTEGSEMSIKKPNGNLIIAHEHSNNTNNYSQRINRPKRIQPIMNEKEKPPADFVKQAKLIFERRPEQRTKKPPLTGEVAAKVGSFNNIIVKAKAEAKVTKKLPVKHVKPTLNEKGKPILRPVSKPILLKEDSVKLVPPKSLDIKKETKKDNVLSSPIPDVSRVDFSSNGENDHSNLSETPDLILTSSPLLNLSPNHKQSTEIFLQEEIRNTSPILNNSQSSLVHSRKTNNFKPIDNTVRTVVSSKSSSPSEKITNSVSDSPDSTKVNKSPDSPTKRIKSPSPISDRLSPTKVNKSLASPTRQSPSPISNSHSPVKINKSPGSPTKSIGSPILGSLSPTKINKPLDSPTKRITSPILNNLSPTKINKSLDSPTRKNISSVWGSSRESSPTKKVTSPLLSPNRVKPASPLHSPSFNRPISPVSPIAATKHLQPLFNPSKSSVVNKNNEVPAIKSSSIMSPRSSIEFDDIPDSPGFKVVSPSSINNIAKQSNSSIFNFVDKPINQGHLPINKNVSNTKVPPSEPLKIDVNINGHVEAKAEVESPKLLQKTHTHTHTQRERPKSPPKFSPPPPPKIEATVLDKVLTVTEIKKNQLNTAKTLQQPSVSVNVASVEVVNTSVVPKTFKSREPNSNTAVFNFTNRKDVPDYISNDKSRTANRPEIPKPGEGGIILLSSNLESFVDEDEEILRSLEGPPSPCDVTFINDNILIDGKSSFSQSTKRTKLKISFVESGPDVFEYPSETSLLLEDDSLVLSPVPLGHTVPTLGGSFLATYTPKTTEDFLPGITRSVQPTPHIPEKPNVPEADSASELLLQEVDRPFSSGTNSDILF